MELMSGPSHFIVERALSHSKSSNIQPYVFACTARQAHRHHGTGYRHRVQTPTRSAISTSIQRTHKRNQHPPSTNGVLRVLGPVLLPTSRMMSPARPPAIAKKLEMLGAPESAPRGAARPQPLCSPLPAGKDSAAGPLGSHRVETADGGVPRRRSHALLPDVTGAREADAIVARPILKLLHATRLYGWPQRSALATPIYTHLPSDEHAPVAHAYDETASSSSLIPSRAYHR